MKWTEHYFKSDYLKADPVIQQLSSRTLPFVWGEVPLTSSQHRTIYQEAKEMGLHDGVAIPIHGAHQDLFFISLATDCKDAAQNAPLDQLRLLAVHLQSSYLRLLNSDVQTEFGHSLLTARERDCLSYCAIGKTSWEIGLCLGISEKTVDFHIHNASIKLNANSRIFAVVKALRNGLISP